MAELGISLNDEQKKDHQELLDGIERIETKIVEPIGSSGDEFADCLAEFSSLSAYAPRLMEIATYLKDLARGIVTEEIINNDVLMNAKAKIIDGYIDGRMKYFNALHAKTVQACKDFDKHLERLRSLLSWEKEKLNKRVGV